MLIHMFCCVNSVVTLHICTAKTNIIFIFMIQICGISVTIFIAQNMSVVYCIHVLWYTLEMLRHT
jgi:hypothetical protein